MNDRPYEDRVFNELSAWLELPPPRSSMAFVGFFMALERYRTSDENTGESGESIRCSVWEKVLEQQAVGNDVGFLKYGLLGELLANQRWRRLERDGHPRVFVSTAIRYIETNCVDVIPECLDGILRARFMESISEWLDPGIDHAVVTTKDIMVSLFGDAWCDLVRDLRGESESWVDLLDLLEPDFLPGRLQSTAGLNAVRLPDLELGS